MMNYKIQKSYFVTGTDTGIGKTWITAILGCVFKFLCYDVGVMKPVSSGGREDAVFLRDQLNLLDELSLINPVYYNLPMSPNVAARIEGKAWKKESIFSAYHTLRTKHEVMLLEGIGGLMVPLHEGYFVRDLIQELKIPVVLVARSSLGTLNHTFLTLEALKSRNIEVEGIILNDCEKSEDSVLIEKNTETIAALAEVPIIAHIPYQKSVTAANQEQVLSYFSSEWLKGISKKNRGRSIHAST